MRIAIVQPEKLDKANEIRNVEDAQRFADEAVQEGAELILFPEGYPGFFWSGNEFTGIPQLQDKAKEHGVHIVGNGVELVDGTEDHWYFVAYLIGPDGEIKGRFVRTTPKGPVPYPRSALKYFGTDECPVPFQTSLGSIGGVICGEMFTPESSRALALQGAEILLYPVGSPPVGRVPLWKHVAIARAVENLTYVALTQAILPDGESGDGAGIIVGPQGIPIVEAKGVGVFVGDVDMDWLRMARSAQGSEVLKIMNRDNFYPGGLLWRRPEVYKDVLNS